MAAQAWRNLPKAESFPGKLLEGWQIGAVATLRTDAPMSFTSSYATVSQNTSSNPAVAVGGATDRQVCSAIGLYSTGGIPSFLPSNFVVPNTAGAAGTTLNANYSVLANPAARALGDRGLRQGCSGLNVENIDANGPVIRSFRPGSP